MEVCFSDPDQYGQVHPVENDELIATKLKAFDLEVSDTPAVNKENVILAETKCPILLDDAFKLQFLRCEVFNVELAAKRYVKYWDKRVEIFGPEKAFQPLTQAGAASEDKVAFGFGVSRPMLAEKDGSFVMAKDPSGRSIMFMDPSRQDKTKYTTMSMVRTAWYNFAALQENEDTQKMGIVLVVYPGKAKFAQFNRDLAKHMAGSIKGCLPGKQRVGKEKLVFPILKLFLGERLRKRIRIHSGSEEDVLKDLEKFGLTKDVLPSELGGDIVLDYQAWLASRLAAGK